MVSLSPLKTPPPGTNASTASKSIDVKTYIINLERDEIRRQAVLQQCKSQGLGDIEMLPAVDGAALSTSRIEKAYSSRGARIYIGRELCRAEIGCALSHMEVYQRVIRDEVSLALVLEDDIQFEPNLKQVIDAIATGGQPDNWEVLLLGHHSLSSRKMITSHNIWSGLKLVGKHKFFRPSEIAAGAYGYLVNQRGAKRLLVEMQQFSKPVDRYTGSDRHINVYVLKPNVISIDNHLNDFHHNMEDRIRMIEEQRSNRFSGLVKERCPTLFRVIKQMKLRLVKVWNSIVGIKSLEKYR
jgi:glycosyl transferase family 25